MFLNGNCYFVAERFKDIALAASGQFQSGNVAANQDPQYNAILDTSQSFISLKQNCPRLILHWCHILQLLGCENKQFWEPLFSSKFGHKTEKWNWTSGVTEHGAVLIYCNILAEVYQVLNCFLIKSSIILCLKVV